MDACSGFSVRQEDDMGWKRFRPPIAGVQIYRCCDLDSYSWMRFDLSRWDLLWMDAVGLALDRRRRIWVRNDFVH